MLSQSPTCAILAERHSILSEGIRGLLETTFKTVYVVADIASLKEGARRLTPAVIVLDLSMMGTDFSSQMQEIVTSSPESRFIVLSVHDQASVARMALEAGADSIVLKRDIGSDFLNAISAILSGEKHVSPGFGIVTEIQ